MDTNDWAEAAVGCARRLIEDRIGRGNTGNTGNCLFYCLNYIVLFIWKWTIEELELKLEEEEEEEELEEEEEVEAVVFWLCSDTSILTYPYMYKYINLSMTTVIAIDTSSTCN